MAHTLSFSPKSSNFLNDRAHIATGDYKAKVVSLSLKYPNLRYPDPELSSDVGGPGKVVVLQLSEGRLPARLDLSHPRKLQQYLEKNIGTTVAEPCRRLFLVEGLDPTITGILGEHFDINPNLFVRQQRTSNWESYHRSGNTPPLPSLLDPSQSFHIPYYELHHYPQGLPDSLFWRSADGCRQIHFSRMPGTFDRVGIVDRKASCWSRKDDLGGWDGRYPNVPRSSTLCNVILAILFLDPPVRDVLLGVKFGSPERTSLPSEPYQGGYSDFMNYINLHDACRTLGPSRESMLEDICYYWTNHSACVDNQEEPMVSAIFLKKIIASNYLILIEYIRAMLSNLEIAWSRQEQDISEIKIAWAEQRWSELQSWSRRCSEYCENVESILDGLGIPVSESQASKDWSSCEKDFHMISRKLRGLKSRSDTLTSSLTGLAGILGNKQSLKEANRSLHEAKSVKILTLLGMMFLPLSLTSQILSMSERFLPGPGRFWIYAAIAMPSVALVFIVVFLINLGYGTDGEWSSKQWKQSIATNRNKGWGFDNLLFLPWSRW